MKYLNISIVIFLLSLMLFHVSCTDNKDNEVMRSMVIRLIPAHADKFLFEVLQEDTIDVFEVESSNRNIVIRGEIMRIQWP